MASKQEPQKTRWWLWYAWEFSAAIGGLVGGLAIALQPYFSPLPPFTLMFVVTVIVSLVMGLVMRHCISNSWPKWDGNGLFVISIGLAAITAIAGIVFATSIFSFVYEHPEIKSPIESAISLFIYYLLALFGGAVIIIFGLFAVVTSKQMRTEGITLVNLAVLCLAAGYFTANIITFVTYLTPSNFFALLLLGSFIGAVVGLFPGIVFLLCGVSPKLQRSSSTRS